MSFFRDLSHWAATAELITSWMWALGVGMGLCSAIPSLLLRQSVMVVWSTPGAAVATAGLAGIGSAFWGVVAGALALFVQQYRAQKTDTP